MALGGACLLALSAWGLWSGEMNSARGCDRWLRSGVAALWLFLNAGIYVYITRAGKFAVWADLLDRLELKGDERLLDIGCGRGAVLLMAAQRLPRGRAVGIDVWSTTDQSGNAEQVTRRNAALEGVAERVELHTADMRQAALRRRLVRRGGQLAGDSQRARRGRARAGAARSGPGAQEGRQAGDRRHPPHARVRQRARGLRAEDHRTPIARRSLLVRRRALGGDPPGRRDQAVDEWGASMIKILWYMFLALMLFPLAVAVCQSPSRDEPEKPQAFDGDKSQSRSVKDQVLTSKELPAVSLRFDKAFAYVGGQSFILHDVARAEQHFFVDADERGCIKRLYWVQFEGYLPGNTHTYRYESTQTVKIGGLEFIADASAENIKDISDRSDSDGSRARAFLEKKGYRMASDDFLTQRLVHLVDEKKRNELLIIYLEDLAPLKLTAKDLADGGRAAAQWGKIAKGLRERAVKGMEVKR